MSRRPVRRRPSYHVEADVTPMPQQPNWVSMLGNQVPLMAVLAAIVGGAVWYGSQGVESKNSKSDIETLKIALTQINKEQDERRSSMAKEFLASNKEISTKVGDLATALAVQQATQQATTAALTKISDQLQQLNSRSGTHR